MTPRIFFQANSCLIIVFICSFIFTVTRSSAVASEPPPSDFSVACRLETDRAVVPEGSSQSVVVKVTLDAPPPPKNIMRPAVNLSIVLDRSGSMNGSKLEKAKEAAIEALRRLGKKDIFSLVVYDDQVNTVIPSQFVTGTERIISRIRNIQSGGNTALYGGVSQGAAEIRKHIGEGYVHRIILLSDGLANVGPSSPADLGRLGASFLKENISVTTIGIGTGYNEDLMAAISQESSGNTYFVESEKDLPRIFASELGDVLNVVAQKVDVTISFPDNIRPVGFIGRDGRIKGQSARFYLNQLYGNQEKYALIEVAVPPGKNGRSIVLASATVNYDNPFTSRRENTYAKTTLSYSSSTAEVKKSVNPVVKKEYQLNLNAIAEEKAIELADEGRQAEAATTLKQSADKLKALAKEYDDADLMEAAEETEAQAEVIEDKGMGQSLRKELRSKSYQKKTQQKLYK